MACLLAALLTSCAPPPPPPPQALLLVDPVYPRDTFTVTNPKRDINSTCELYSLDEAAVITGTPTTSDQSSGCFFYYGPDGLLSITTSSSQIDRFSYEFREYGRRATVAGNSAWVLDYGPGNGCDVSVAITTNPTGRSLNVDVQRNDNVTCDELIAIAETVLTRAPTDPTVEPRIIPDLDRQRAVIPPARPIPRADYSVGLGLPDTWTTTTLDDPRYRHDTDATPAW